MFQFANFRIYPASGLFGGTGFSPCCALMGARGRLKPALTKARRHQTFSALKGRAVFAAAICLFAAAPSAQAGAVLQAGQDTFAEIGVQLQAVSLVEKNQAGALAGNPNVAGDEFENYLKTGRLSLSGQVTPLASFYLQMANDNAGKNYAPVTTSLLDSWVMFNFSTGGKLVVGIFPVQFSRSRLATTASTITMDRPFMDEFQLDSGGLAQKRDRGLMLWGNLSYLQYRIAVGDGAAPLPQNAGGQSLRIHGRVHLSFGTPESDFRYKEGYRGERNVLTIGYGFDRQNNASQDAAGAPANYSAWTGDLLLESKTGSGASTITYSYYSYDWGNPERLDTNGNYVQGNGWQAMFAQTAMEGGAGIQPYARYAAWNSTSAATGASQNRLAFGLNYLFKGDSLKMGAEYEQVRFPDPGATWDKRNYDRYGVQWQLVY